MENIYIDSKSGDEMSSTGIVVPSKVASVEKNKVKNKKKKATRNGC